MNLHNLRKIQILVLLLLAGSFTACDSKVETQKEQPLMVNKQYEEDISQLRQEVSTLDTKAEEQQKSFKLTYEAQRRAHDYLDSLSANINENRGADLPKWEDMYQALTNEDALSGAFTLNGNKTNFATINEEVLKNDEVLQDLITRVNAHAEDVRVNKARLDAQDEELRKMTKGMQDLVAKVNTDTKHVEKVLDNYSTRLDKAESRVLAFEANFSDFSKKMQENTAGLQASADRILNELRDFPLDETRKQIDRVASKLAQNEAQLDMNETNIKQAVNQMDVLEVELGKQGVELNVLDSDIKEIFTAVDQIYDLVAKWELGIVQAEQLKQEIQAHSDTLKKIKEDIEKTQEGLDGTNTNITATGNEIAAVLEKLQQLQQQLDAG